MDLSPHIRPETAADHAAVFDVNHVAFGRDDEARLVEALRQGAEFVPELSLVALHADEVVGHVLFTPIHIDDGTRKIAAIALAPVAVRPARQNQGIGSALIRHGLQECRRLGHRIVVVLGHADYYPRFGFVRASAHGIRAPFPVRDASFMVQELVPQALDGVEGTVWYPAAFAAV